MALLLLLPLASAALASATKLPSFTVGTAGASRVAGLQRDGRWWAHIGDKVYHAPPAMSGLSEDVGDYYYALGSAAALPAELRDRRVGGQGRLHIFHLPEGSSMLQADPPVGTRRKALSALIQLKDGMNVSRIFPPFEKDSGYINPLSQQGQALEKEVVGRITPGGVMAALEKVTAFDTRSYQNPEASKHVQEFLKSEFAGMNYTTCLHTFRNGGPATNIVGFVRGAAKPTETVLIGAHYDSIPAEGSAPGAEDNGSGVAALLAIMRALKDAGVKPEKSVLFVAFAGEEPGLLGSSSFAKELVSARSTIPGDCAPPLGEEDTEGTSGHGGSLLDRRRLRTSGFLHVGRRRSPESVQAIIMDEVGWQSPSLSKPTVNLESYDWTRQSVMEHLAHSSADHNGDALLVVHSSHPFGSDHMSFLHKNIPAVLTINGDDEAYPFYHSSQDKITAVTGSLLASITKMNAGALVRMAGVSA